MSSNMLAANMPAENDSGYRRSGLIPELRSRERLQSSQSLPGYLRTTVLRIHHRRRAANGAGC